MTLRQLREYITKELTPAVGGTEASAMAAVIMEDVLKADSVTIALNPEREVEPENLSQVESITRRVIAGEPLQYILGSTFFHGLRLKVNKGVLIPRPETSALVDIVCDTVGKRSDLSVLDVGTGSGAIAVALARELPFSSVTAVDFSDIAVATTQANCEALGVKNVKVMKRDILAAGLPAAEYDIIVSNPPYVEPCEKASIDSRVLDYEPHSALFVPESNPLVFYRRIVNDASEYLKLGGWLFFEINPRQADNMKALLKHNDFEMVEILRDYTGKNRYAVAQKTAK